MGGKVSPPDALTVVEEKLVPTEADQSTLKTEWSTCAKLASGCCWLLPFYCFCAASKIYDMLGNAWEWVSGGEPARRTLRGGSFVDYDPLVPETKKKASAKSGQGGGFKQGANHAITPGTRMETTQDSGSANTSFRCASPAPSKTDGPGRKEGEGRGAAGGRGKAEPDIRREL